MASIPNQPEAADEPKKSSFVKKILNRILSSSDTLNDIFYEVAKEVFYDPSYVKIFGILSRMMIVALTAYFFTVNFVSLTQTDKFISIDKQSGNCSDIPKNWTIPILNADLNGYWEGQSGYNPAYNVYEFQLNGFVADPAAYAQFIGQFDTALKQIGSIGKSNSLAKNLLYWHSWSYEVTTTYGSPAQQLFRFPSDASIIMNKDKISGTISSIYANCTAVQTTVEYDAATALQTITIPSVSSYMAGLSCNSLNPYVVGWNALISGDSLSINIDVQSLFNALSVAYGVKGLSKYTVIDTIATGTFNGKSYTAVEVVYSKAPENAAPLTCLGPTTSGPAAQGSAGQWSQWNCVLRVGSSYGVPFLTHAGPNNTYPTPCSCGTTAGQSSACDSFNLLSGVVLYDASSNPSVSSAYPIALRPFLPVLELFYSSSSTVGGVTGAQVSDGIFNAAFAASFGQKNPYFSTSAWKQNAYKVTKTKNFGAGTLIVFNTYSSYDYTITPKKFQLTNGACADAFSSPYVTSRLASVPWGPLTENYFVCTMNVVPALINAIGIGLSTAAFLVPFGLIFIMYSVLAIVSMLSARKGMDKKPVVEFFKNSEALSTSLAMIKLIEIISKPNPVTAAELDQLRRFQLILLASLPEEQQAASTEDFLRKWEAFQIQYNVKIPGSIEMDEALIEEDVGGQQKWWVKSPEAADIEEKRQEMKLKKAQAKALAEAGGYEEAAPTTDPSASVLQVLAPPALKGLASPSLKKFFSFGGAGGDDDFITSDEDDYAGEGRPGQSAEEKAARIKKKSLDRKRRANTLKELKDLYDAGLLTLAAYNECQLLVARSEFRAVISPSVVAQMPGGAAETAGAPLGLANGFGMQSMSMSKMSQSVTGLQPLSASKRSTTDRRPSTKL